LDRDREFARRHFSQRTASYNAQPIHLHARRARIPHVSLPHERQVGQLPGSGRHGAGRYFDADRDRLAEGRSTTALRCPSSVLEKTLDLLRQAGSEEKEGIVLWLATRPVFAGSMVVEAYVPDHVAKVDYFHIPAVGMRALMGHLRGRKLCLAAQVHSHPGRAFHSLADDKWAIVRHEGALSLVVPSFAARVSAENFTQVIAAFRLAADDRWIEVTPVDLPLHLQITELG
jgi:hypothetical protein